MNYDRMNPEDYEAPELYVSVMKSDASPVPAIQLTDRESADRILLWLSPPKSVRVFDENEDLIELQVWTTSPTVQALSNEVVKPDIILKPTYWAVMSPRKRVYSVHNSLFTELFRRKESIDEPSR